MMRVQSDIYCKVSLWSIHVSESDSERKYFRYHMIYMEYIISKINTKHYVQRLRESRNSLSI